jgi:hypothetical protein
MEQVSLESAEVCLGRKLDRYRCPGQAMDDTGLTSRDKAGDKVDVGIDSRRLSRKRL